MIYLQLFWSFCQIGLFSFGGGYAALPLIRNQVVEVHPWLTMGQFSDIVTISQMTPGPIAINSATFVGIQVAGIPGAVAATLGCVFPACILVMVLAMIYQKYRDLRLVKGILGGLRPAVVGMIAASGLSLLLLSLLGTDTPALALSGSAALDPRAAVLFAVSLFVLRKWKPDPLLIMGGTALAGIVLYQIK